MMRLVDDEGAAGRQRVERLLDQHLLGRQIPVVQDVAHQDHVGFRQGLLEETPGLKTEPVGHANGRDILFEDRRHLRQVEPHALQVRIGERNLGREVALRGADVGERAVVLPRERPRDRHVGAVADAGHGGEELLEPCRIGVERFEEAGSTRLDLVLRCAGAKRLRQVRPERIESMVRHLEDAAHVGGLLPIEEEIGLGRVGVLLAVPRKEAERDEGIEEVARRTRVQPQASAERVEVLGPARELREDAHLDRAQERLRGPKGQTGLQNLLGIRWHAQ